MIGLDTERPETITIGTNELNGIEDYSAEVASLRRLGAMVSLVSSGKHA